jgi:hypothetical protein
MGGSNLSDDAVTELYRRFEGTHLHHLADSPFNCSAMAHYGASFDSHVFSLSGWVTTLLVHAEIGMKTVLTVSEDLRRSGWRWPENRECSK